MWHYNFDYLSHGTNGYKYIDKYRGKKGNWVYVYNDQTSSGGGRGGRTYSNVNTAQRERERAIKEGMSSNRQWDRNRVSKGSSVEAAQKSRTKAVAEGRSANKDWYNNPTVKSKKSLIDYEKTGAELRNRVENLRDRVADKYNQASNSVNEAKDRFKEGHAQSEARKAEQRAANKAKSDKIKNKFKSDYDKAVSSVKDTLNKMAEEAVKNQNENNRRQRSDDKTIKNFDRPTKITREVINRAKNEKGDVNRSIREAVKNQNENNRRQRSDDKTIKNFDRPTKITREVINRAKNEKGDVNRSIREAEIAKSVAKTQKVNEQLNREQWKSAANQQEAERRRSTAAIDAQNARQKSIEASQARQRQAAAAKQQEAERKQAGNRSVERAQAARSKGMDESVRKTWEQKAKAEIKNKAQFDRKQDELVQLCNNFQKQWRAEDENRNLLGMRSQKKIDEQRAHAVANWASKIKNAASLLAASDVKAMDKETYDALSKALYAIRAYRDVYNQGGVESKNNNDVRNKLYYKKDETKDLVREIEDILEEAKLNEDYLYEDVTREKLLREKKIK